MKANAMDAAQVLESAWKWREERGLFAETEALRVFHGPGESVGVSSLAEVAIDLFGQQGWVTGWESGGSKKDLDVVREFLARKGLKSAVLITRPKAGVPEEPTVLFGEPPQGRFEVKEGGARFLIQLLEARHPGLFLDHFPLRKWLVARSRGWKVLNTFAYTGSLSVAAGLGGAREVVTLDLSKPSVQWAEENWKANSLPAAAGNFIFGDVFEWLPRLGKEAKRKGELFDCVILDPPSFSHGSKGSKFSTSKDLKRLHLLAMDLLASGGFLVTSINSANVSWEKYESEVFSAAQELGKDAQILTRIDLPETFPTPLGDREGTRYLKGWILRV